jgi:hypothetical protein
MYYQIDRTDVMLAGLRQRARNGRTHPGAAARDRRPPAIALASRNSESQTVTLVLDAATAESREQYCSGRLTVSPVKPADALAASFHDCADEVVH